MRDLSKQLEDKEFVKAYFRGVETGEDVTKRLLRDDATLNSPDLIARLVGWLEEAEPSDENAADAANRAEQEVAMLNLPSQEKEEEETSEDSGGNTSSDGTSRGQGEATSRPSQPATSTGFGSSNS